MAKFQNLTEAFWYIRENPLEYFPEKSLSLFQHFWMGYEMRYQSRFEKIKSFPLLDGFHQFVAKKYKVTSSHGSFSIIKLYSKSEAEAFDQWFSYLNEFLSKERRIVGSSEYLPVKQAKEIIFFELLETILKRPAIYVGNTSFTFVASLISGWIRATQDFSLEESEHEKTFRKFQKYIEEKEINMPSPTWDKIIWFWSQSEESSLKMFSEYLDEFAFQGKGFIENVEFRWKLRNGADISDLIDLEG